jgi:WD40 repeat protein
MYNARSIQISPLQTYVSALLFSPSGSLMRRNFETEVPNWIAMKSDIEVEWNARLQTIEGHERQVHSIQFSQDSKKLVSADNDTIRIWDAGNGQCLQEIKKDPGWSTSAKFSHDSTKLASVTFDHKLKIWDLSSGKCLQTLGNPHLDNADGVRIGLAFAHNTTNLASASYDHRIRMWNINNGKCLQIFKGHDKRITSLAFSYDSVLLASASLDSTVRVWDTESGECLQTIMGQHQLGASIPFSFNSSTWVAVASYKSTVRIWDAGRGNCLHILKGHCESVRSVAFSSYNPTWLASASWDQTIKIWDSESGCCLKTFRGSPAALLTFSNDSARLASTGLFGIITIWDADGNDYPHMSDSHQSAIRAITFSNDSTRLASGTLDGIIKMWKVESRECFQTLKGHRSWVDSIAFSPDSSRLASMSLNGTLKIWDVNSGNCLHAVKTSYRNLGSATSVAFSCDSARLATSSGCHIIRIFDAHSGKCLQTFGKSEQAFDDNDSFNRSAASSHDFSSLASSSLASNDRLFVVAFSRDSTKLASAGSDSTFRIWDTGSGKCLQMLKYHDEIHTIYSLAFSRCSTRLASSSNHGVSIWDTMSGQCLQTLDIRTILHNISFDDTASSLHTDVGSVALDVDSTLIEITDKTELQKPRYLGVGMKVNEEWITYNSKNIVWIPFEYRPMCWALSGRTVAIGTAGGKVWMCTLEKH